MNMSYIWGCCIQKIVTLGYLYVVFHAVESNRILLEVDGEEDLKTTPRNSCPMDGVLSKRRTYFLEEKA